MATVRARFDTRDAQKALRELRAKAPQAISRALNRAIDSARVQLVRDTAKDLKLKQAEVKDRTSITGATAGRPVARITASSKLIPAIAFSARGPEPSRGRGRGVTTKLPSGRLPHAFIATMKRRGVFVREGRGRGPVREVMGPSVRHVAEKHANAAAQRGLEQLEKRLAVEFKFATRGS